MPNRKPSRINTNTHTDTHTSSNVIFKLLKTKDKCSILKATGRKRNITCREEEREL